MARALIFVLGFALANAQSTLCPQGKFVFRDNCWDCAPGSFQSDNLSSKTSCDKCPSGFFQSSASSAACILCHATNRSDNERTECVFSSDPIPVQLIVANKSKLCLQLELKENVSFQISFELKEKQAHFTFKSTCSVISNSPVCNIITSSVRNTTTGCIESVDTSALVSFHYGSTTRFCIIDSGVDIRNRIVRNIELREVRDIQGDTTFSDYTWSAPVSGWKIKESCDNLKYLNDTHSNPQNWKCIKCPAHASCDGPFNWDDVKPQNGCFREQDKTCIENITGEFFPCMFEDACLGDKCNSDLGFAEQSRGCRACRPNHFAEGNVRCTECPETMVTILTTIASCAILALLLTIFLNKSLADSERLSTKMDVTYSNLAQSMEKIMIAHAQILGLISGFPLEWPGFIQTFFWIFELFSNPAAHLFNPGCYGFTEIEPASSLILIKQAIVLILPFFLTTFISLFWWIRWKCSHSSLWSKIVAHGKACAFNNKKTTVVQTPLSRSTSNISHLSRESLENIFKKADRNNIGHITKSQFSWLVLSHRAVFGPDWKPQKIKMLFDRGGKFTQDSQGRQKKTLAFEEFIAGVVEHFHSQSKMNQKLREANGFIDMVEHHDGSKRGAESITHYDKWINTVISLLFMMYPTLCVATFSLVGCSSVGHCSFLQQDMEVECWKKEHNIWVVLVFVPAFIGYVLGLPFISQWVLRRNQTLLHTNRRVKFQLSILCVGYRPGMEHWETVVSLRKGLVVGISIFVLAAGPKLQTLTAQVLIGLLLVLQASYKPYVKVATRHDPLNSGETLGLGSAFLTMTAGMYLHHYQDNNQTGMFTNTASILVILVNLTFFAVAIRWYMVIFLVDLEMALERSGTKDISSTMMAFCMQYFLPDWREESHFDKIRDNKEHKRRIAQLVSVNRLMRLKDFARRWAQRTRRHMEHKAVDTIELEAKKSRGELNLRIAQRFSQSRRRLFERINNRSFNNAVEQSRDELAKSSEH